MTFKFNFLGDEAAGGGADAPTPPPPAPPPPPAAPAVEVPAADAAPPGDGVDAVDVGHGLLLLKGAVTAEQAAALLRLPALAASDLEPGRYEGGFKLWEGAVDLAEWLADALLGGGGGGSRKRAADGPLAAALAAGGARPRAIELGCGHGLPGLVALLAGGCEVHFADYNAEVLRALTAPNVGRNWPRAGAAYAAGAAAPPPPPARYFAGDWALLGDLLRAEGLAGGYDLVLSAETVYSPASVAALLACVARCLRRPAGVALVAGKAFYFGVGGGTGALRAAAAAAGLAAETVAAVDGGGASTRREIVRLTWSDGGPS